MSIAGIIGGALTAYGAYSGMQQAKYTSRIPAAGAGGRLLTGAVAGAAGYLAGSENGYAPRRRRAKGITGAELRGFNKTCRLLSKVGMVPRKLKGARTVGRKCK